MKRIYTLLTAALMMAGTALWSGCGNNELPDSASGSVTSQEVESFGFSIKGLGTQTRATSEEGIDAENAVKTMYVALFVKDNADEQASKLHRIYCQDDAAVEGWKDLKITKDGDTYSITKVGTVGDYIVYFIANPDKKIKDDLLSMQQVTGDGRATLSAFESALETGDNTADGKTDDEGTTQAEEGNQRGFIMLGKENVTLSETTNINVSLTRLAARFDFINSAATTENNEVTITKIEFSNSAKSSLVAASSTLTATGRLETKTLTGNFWPNQVGEDNKFTTYTYENLITDNAVNRTMITVYYTLGASGKTESKKLNIDLKEAENFIGVTRNHLYRIYLNGVSGQFKLEVADWKEGNTVKVPNEDLTITYDPNNPQENFYGKVGDYACINATTGELYFADGGLREITLDGTLKKWDSVTLNSTQQSECVGIVFSNLTSEKDKAAGYSRGYVMSLKNAGIGLALSKQKSIPAGYPINSNALKETILPLDGFTNCNLLKQDMKNNPGNQYPAITALESYAVKAPAESSGWYVPTVGQLVLFACNVGKLPALLSTLKSTTFVFDGTKYYIAPANYKVDEGLENALKLVGNSNYDKFGGQNVMTCSVGSQSKGNVLIYANMSYTSKFTMNGSTVSITESSQFCLRPVFAF